MRAYTNILALHREANAIANCHRQAGRPYDNYGAPTTRFYMGSGIAIEAGWFTRLVSSSLAHQFAASLALSNHYQSTLDSRSLDSRSHLLVRVYLALHLTLHYHPRSHLLVGVLIIVGVVGVVDPCSQCATATERNMGRECATSGGTMQQPTCRQCTPLAQDLHTLRVRRTTHMHMSKHIAVQSVTR